MCTLEAVNSGGRINLLASKKKGGGQFLPYISGSGVTPMGSVWACPRIPGLRGHPFSRTTRAFVQEYLNKTIVPVSG
jgi:hypothetical protein